MKILVHTWSLIKKEARLELKNMYGIASVILYVVAIIVVLYLSLASQGANKNIEVKYWNVLFWIMLLFAAINTIAKSFIQENSSKYLYYYSLVSPLAIILSKMIYNALLMLSIAIVSALLFALVLGSPVQNIGVYFIVILLGALSFSFLFTLVSSIASKAGNIGLTAILGLPLIVIILIYLMKLSREAFFAQTSENFFKTLGIIILFDFMLFMLSIILFPYLWRD
ncbi:MAG: heme exporter protein CcmB [Bacteroidota bacterium]